MTVSSGVVDVREAESITDRITDVGSAVVTMKFSELMQIIYFEFSSLGGYDYKNS